ncbi:hypothetical protein ACUXV3_20275 (plasmid) [Roseobacteraceae bacterium NS-SX3]
MQLGILLAGMLFGGGAAAAALVLGHSPWQALALYSGLGTLAALAVLARGLAAACLRDGEDLPRMQAGSGQSAPE